jgi:hypothetical protein
MEISIRQEIIKDSLISISPVQARSKKRKLADDNDSSSSGGSGSEASDSSGDDSQYSPLFARKCRLLCVLSNVDSILNSVDFTHLPTHARSGNQLRDRASILHWAHGLDDLMFKRQFRLDRRDFMDVLRMIKSDISTNQQKAINSSGSPVTAELRLMITMRILAGASYLDMAHYQVQVDSVSKIVWGTVQALHKHLNNVHVANSAAEIDALAKGWAQQQFRRWNAYLTAGTIYAGDGFAIEIQQPSEGELQGRPLSTFRNRKGFWGLIAQAFCDVNARFDVFDVRWPGGTNDIIAYPMTDMYRKATSGYFPEWCTFVMDEAYSSCGGMHLSPFSIHQLRKAKSSDIDKYYKMLAFNHVLSSQRITIERAFGILVARWGILWRPIQFKLWKVATIVKVCAMLHNVCVSRWVSEGRCVNRSGQQCLEVPPQVRVEDGMPSESAVMERLHNNYVDARRRSADSSCRNTLMEDIYDAGIRMYSDTEFHQL